MALAAPMVNPVHNLWATSTQRSHVSQAANKRSIACIPEIDPKALERAEREYREDLARLLREVRRSSRAFSRVFHDSIGDAHAEAQIEPLLTSLLEVFAAAEHAASILEASPGVSEEALDVVASARAALELTEIGISLVIAGRHGEDIAA
jgi:hypothetical protein